MDKIDVLSVKNDCIYEMYKPDIKEKTVEIAMNGSGCQETAPPKCSRCEFYARLRFREYKMWELFFS